MEIKIKNKFYNSKNLLKMRKFNEKCQKKRIKLAKKDDNDKNSIFSVKPYEFDYELKNNEFFHFNGYSHIIFVGSKIKINDFYDEILKVVKTNPRNTSFLSTIFNENFKNEILNGIGSNNFGYTECGEFSPDDNELKDIVEQIDIRISSLSNESYFVDFVVIYDKKFNTYMNDLLIKKYDSEVRYFKNFINGKNRISCSLPTQYSIRTENVDNIMFEIKDRIINFINKNFDCFYESELPRLSIEEYRTNLNYNSGFLRGFNLLITEQMTQNLSDINSSKRNIKYFIEDNNKHFKNHFEYELNRRRLIFFTKEDETVTFYTNFDFEVYKLLLIKELGNLQSLFEEKNKLLNDISRHIKCISLSKYYSRYCSLKIKENNILEILKSNKIKTMRLLYCEKDNNTFFDYIIKETNRLECEKEDLDKSVDSLLSLKTNTTSLVVASFASFCALVTLIVTIIFSICQNK